jgi:putative membrane protein
MKKPLMWIWLITFFGVLVWSAIAPKDYPTWVLEVSPALVAFVLLAVTRRRFPFTTMVYVLILVHAIILMVGGHYTYAEVPLFDRISELLGATRNNYDKLGHVAQGLVPAMVAREILIRNAVVNGAAWMNLFIVCFCLALSAIYELLEWWVALLSGEAADAFLGTQGYVWDTQSDMFWALLGAVIALLVLAKPHDRQLRRLLAASRMTPRSE